MPIDRIGLQKTSLVDYPGRVAAVLFTHGCPLRCPYCHNPNLVSGPVPEEFLSRGMILGFLQRRRTVLGGVVISGGEPLLHPDLDDLVREITGIGPAVKIDTSGAFPGNLERVLSLPGTEYVAMDIKTSPQRYDRVQGDGQAVIESMRVIRNSGKRYQFRTTLAPGVLEQDDLEAITALIRPGETWVVNPFKPGNCLDGRWNSREAPSYREPSAATRV